MSATPKRDWRGMTGAAVFMLLGAAVLYHSKDFSKLGSVFPQAIAWAMLLFAIATIVRAWVKPSPGIAPEKGSMPRRVLLVIAMLAWALSLNVLGFLSSSALAFVLLLLIAKYDRWTPRMAINYLLLGAVLLGGIYIIFRYGLQVPLPGGALI